MDDVPSMNGTAIVALQSRIDDMRHQHVPLVLSAIASHLILKLHRAGIHKRSGELSWCRNQPRAFAVARRWLADE